MRNAVFFCLGFFCFTSLVQDALASTDTREPLFAEELFLTFDLGRSDMPKAQKTLKRALWAQISLEGGEVFPEANRWYPDECVYETSLAIIQGINVDPSAGEAYQRFWIKNQNRVFAVCLRDGSKALSPVFATDEVWPERAKSDFEYQLASWHFYQRQYDDALSIYKKLASQKAAPIRPYAAYMQMRTLAHLRRGREAYLLADEILEDSSLRTIHKISENYKLILMNTTSVVPIRRDPELARKHFLWLLDNVVATSGNAASIPARIEILRDSRSQLDQYFPLFDPVTATRSWWLDREFRSNSSRMMAVKELAAENEFVDWMQAKWASVERLDDAPNWVGQLLQQSGQQEVDDRARIAEHAWRRLQGGGRLDWLLIALVNADPESAITEEFLSAAEPFLNAGWANESAEYQKWFGGIWTESIRILLMRADDEQAMTLFRDHIDFISSDSAFLPGRTVDAAISWFSFKGKLDTAQALFALVEDLTVYRQSELKRRFSLILAEQKGGEEGEFFDNAPFWDGKYRETQPLWRAMVNVMSSENLLKLTKKVELSTESRQKIALAGLTRSILLKNERLIDAFSLVVAKLLPELRLETLKTAQFHNQTDYLSLILITPRMRPFPFLVESKLWGGEYRWLKTEEKLSGVGAIDTYNHNDNNWWCRPSSSERMADVLSEMQHLLLGVNYEELRSKRDGLSTALYFWKERKLFENHPFLSTVDYDELQELEKISAAPRYLSEAVMDLESWNGWKFWRGAEERNQSAMMLNYAIRTTRYGCQNDGSHAEYSREAYDLLHRNYGQTVWAKSAPYWFGCEHFRDGCDIKE
ncbi:MAG: hypothetical protein RIG26_12425 [Thalassospira sp.]|uniref:hypothetical protein n=1 Tax=Thalassospira sp. TaxID=1912094 RepID=UPI0032F0572D